MADDMAPCGCADEMTNKKVDLCSMGVSQLGEAYRAGTVSPIDVVDACLAHIKLVDGGIGAWQEVYEDEARAAAVQAAEKLKSISSSDCSLSPMFGVPFALKDIIDVEGKVTTAGCIERLDHVATATATIAERLLASGGILLGKVKTVEFARGGWGENEWMGPPRNPWTAGSYKHLACGGSSSGSGAAVAARTVPCAVGTDTGGSVRLPAAMCGVVGLKTTKEMLPTDGVVPLSHTFDTPGPLARSVLDAAIFCSVMMEPTEGSQFLSRAESAMQIGVDGMRFGVMGEKGRAHVTSPKQLEAFDQAIEQLRALGADIVPYDFDSFKYSSNAMSKYEGYFHHKDIVEDASKRMDSGVRSRMFAGKEITLEEYVACQLSRKPAIDAFIEGMQKEGIVAWLSPTTNGTPIEITDIDSATMPVSAFTSFVNFLGLCAISVPTGPTVEECEEMSLPTSLQIACLPNEEVTALRIARAYEAARGPIGRPPLSMPENREILPRVEASPFRFPLVDEFEPRRVCLLVIDMQRDFLEEGGYWTRCGYDVKPLAATIAPIAAVLEAARACGGISIMHTRQGLVPSELSATGKAQLASIGVDIEVAGKLGKPLVVGEEGWQISPLVSPIDGEQVINKKANSSFIGTDLHARLQAMGINKLIICGITLDCCVHSTLRNANDLGYQTLLLEDCCGCLDSPELPSFHKIMIDSIKIEGGIHGTVGSSTSLIHALQTASSK